MVEKIEDFLLTLGTQQRCPNLIILKFQANSLGQEKVYEKGRNKMSVFSHELAVYVEDLKMINQKA